MITCTRRIEFDAGHRVMGYHGKCQYLHGHRYVLEITATCLELDELGMVVDFALLKQLVSEWIDTHFDHNVLLAKEDHHLGENIASITHQKIYYLPYNPTAENILRYLSEEIIPKLFAHQPFTITKLKLFETPNCSAEIILS